MECNELLSYLKDKYSISDDSFYEKTIEFLATNNWFGIHPKLNNKKKIELNDTDADMLTDRLKPFLSNFSCDTNKKTETLYSMLESLFPQTKLIVEDFFNKHRDYFKDNGPYYLMNFLYSHLVDEICELSDKEVSGLMDDALHNLNVANCNMLSIFLSDTKKNYRTRYVGDYFLEKNDLKDNDAYELDEYCRIMYHMFNEDYIEQNQMYKKACENKDYIDIWLFISLHFVCALRNSDLIKLPHPALPYEPNDVLAKIRNNEFTKEDALKVIYSVVWNVEYRMAKPNKTSRYNVDTIKFFIPKSIEEHMGKLFAIAESWYQLKEKDGALIRVITDYETINKVMGEEIGNLFLESDFKSRKANKSYMQIIEVLTDSVIGMNEDFHIKGYMMASLARSHKGSYGTFAKTTIKYLKDQKMTGYSPEFVAKELFERGVLSYIPKMLLSIITDRDFDKLDIHSQTSMINKLGLTPLEVEGVIKLNDSAMEEANKIVAMIYRSEDKKQTITDIVHKIGNGEAVSKNKGTLCLLTAVKGKCLYGFNNNCSICPYEISTKYTLMNMVHETKRLKMLYKNSSDSLEKNKCKQLLILVAKSIDQMLTCYEDTYGKDDALIIKNIIRSFNEEN